MDTQILKYFVNCCLFHKKLLKNRVQHDCGLGFESFVEKIQDGEPLLYKTLGTFLDPAGDIQGGKNYPEQNQEIKFLRSWLNYFLNHKFYSMVMKKNTKIVQNKQKNIVKVLTGDKQN